MKISGIEGIESEETNPTERVAWLRQGQVRLGQALFAKQPPISPFSKSSPRRERADLDDTGKNLE